jgi:tetratricopeptide (TPR) repeat protein
MLRLLNILMLLCNITIAQKPFQVVREQLAADSFKRAGTILDSCIKMSYHLDSSYYYKGIMYVRGEKPKSAKQFFDKLEKEFPDFYDRHYLGGLIFFIQKDFGKSIEEFNNVLKTDQNNLKALYNRALAFGLLEDYKTAKEDLTKCIELFPSYALAYYSRGYWSELSGDFPEAIKDYEQAISINPKTYDAYLGLAHTYQLQKNDEKACEVLGRAIAAGSQIAEEIKDSYCR